MPALIESLEDEKVSLFAHQVLQSLTQKNFPHESTRWKDWWKSEQEKYQSELPQVLENLQSEDSELRRAAVKKLAQFTLLGKEEATHALWKCKDDPDEQVRAEAARVLQGME